MLAAPNTPKTAWIRDNGTVIETTTDVLVDELGNFLVDESGNNLLDSLSTDGVALPHTWNETAEPTTFWSDSNITSSEATRTTEQGDTRVTAQGDTRIVLTSDRVRQPLTSWSEDEY